ncbi:MAG: hypothetical protein KIT11_08115 [Fimbriimonadaceae bacterium]|nr:hypothetical protein [Fimbriimonadaceae bacterium]QYK56319.1 MAG: hypothetical protein KF733_02310 [Fimbriimonadaceae bacterium]
MKKRGVSRSPRKQRSWVGRLAWGAFMFLLLPAGLFAVGYSLIGPRIGQYPALQAGAERVAGLANNKKPNVAPAPEKPAPIIEISVEKSSGKKTAEDSRKTPIEEIPKPTPKRKPKPAEPAREKVEPEKDSKKVEQPKLETTPATPENDPASGSAAGANDTGGG